MSVEHHLDDGSRVIEMSDGSRLVFVREAIGPRALLPRARVGRSAIGAGGLLARLWHWFRLPAVERFRRCALCGLARDADRRRSRRTHDRVCTGWIGEPYNRCMSAVYHLR